MTCTALVGVEDKNPCGLTPTVGPSGLCRACLKDKMRELDTVIYSVRAELWKDHLSSLNRQRLEDVKHEAEAEFHRLWAWSLTNPADTKD